MAVDRDLKLAFLKAMLHARAGDEVEQTMKATGAASFALSAQGHEALASIAFAMKPEDWLHPHYRDRAICLARGLSDDEVFLDFFAKGAGPSGGRQMPVHYNSRALRIVSLSTPVATNMLQAAGLAMSIKERKVPEVVVATIGDAATREGESYEAIALAASEKLPVVFVIEDNGYGISTRTDGRTFWTMDHSIVGTDGSWFHGCRVVRVDGLDPEAVFTEAASAIEKARARCEPSILVARVERLKSHSSSDDQRVYRSEAELRDLEKKDPVKLYSERCVREGILSALELENLKDRFREQANGAAGRARAAAEPDTAREDSNFAPLPDLPTSEILPRSLEKSSGGKTMAQCIEITMEQEMRRNNRIFLYGEDIEDPKGDVFGITRSLSGKFPQHVRNSPLAEATILGTAIGRALAGDLAVATIQFIDFMGPALNQLFNELITFYWRSCGQWNTPVTILAPYGAYLPGVGPWHSQTNEAIFAHMPGLEIAIPSTAGDAAGLLRFALRCNRPVLFLYPKKLLHGAENTVESPGEDCIVPFGVARTVQTGRDVTIVTWGNCVPISTAAAAASGASVEILDLRTIIPWDQGRVIESVKKTGRLIVVHEDAITGGFGAEVVAVVTGLAFDSLKAPPVRIAKPDVHNPFNYKMELDLLPDQNRVEAAIRTVTGAQPVPRQHPAQTAAIGLHHIRVPRHSPTDEDAILVGFRVKVGDQVAEGDVLAEMEANKGVFEIASSAAGVIKVVHGKPGDRLLCDDVLIEIEGAVPATTDDAGLRLRALTPAQIQVGELAKLSAREIPQSSVECEIDATRLVQIKNATSDHLHPTITHLLFWCMISTMRQTEHELFRCTLSRDGRSVVLHGTINAGFAAVGPAGDLYAPVVKRAGDLNFESLVRKMAELTQMVRSGNVKSEDLQDATMTLTNIGAFGVTLGTPFVIPGQTAILAAGSIRNDKSAGDRSLLAVRLVFDHRIMNGSHAARFLADFRSRTESLELNEFAKPSERPRSV